MPQVEIQIVKNRKKKIVLFWSVFQTHINDTPQQDLHQPQDTYSYVLYCTITSFDPSRHLCLSQHSQLVQFSSVQNPNQPIMTDPSHPNNSMASIRNPYINNNNSHNNNNNNNNHHHHHHLSRFSTTTTMPSVLLAPAAHEPYISNSTAETETMIRNLLRSMKQQTGTKAALPSLLASVQVLKEQLKVRRGNEHVQWSAELAREFGTMVMNVNCIVRYASFGSEAATNADVATSEAVGAAVLGLLATVMEDWEDHVLYAVIVQEGNSNDGNSNISCGDGGEKTETSKKLVCWEHLLDMLTQLSVRSDITNNAHHDERHRGESIHQNAIICLATAWRCLERLEQFTTLTSGNNNGGYSSREQRGIPWWISEGQLMNSLSVTSLQSLCRIYCSSDSEPDDDFSFQQFQQESQGGDQEQRKISLLTIVVILLRYQLLELSTSSVSSTTTISASSSMGGCITIPERKLSELTSKLIKEIQILNHSVLSPSSSKYTLPIAMVSMSALSLLQRSMASSEHDSLFHGLNQTIQSTGLVENLVQFTFFSSVSTDGNGPRWTTASLRKGHYLQSFGLHLFSCWSFCDNAAWKVLVANLEPKLNFLIDTFWSNLLENGYSTHPQNPSMNDGCTLEGQLPVILWLYFYMRGHARYRLSLVLEKTLGDLGGAVASVQQPQCGSTTQNIVTTSKERALGKLVHSLFGSLRLFSGKSYSSRLMVARLLRILLADRRTISTNDDLSRCLWSVVDESVVVGHFEAVLEHACTDDAAQPLLLALVDTMETMLEYNKCCNYLVDDKLGAHNLEALIYLVKPKNIRYDFILGMDEEAADTDTETPPLHNLSRMDEASICIEHEEIKEPRGLDHSVRLSVATALAHLAYGSSVAPPDESIGLLVSRISTSVNNVLVDYQATIERGGNGEGDSNGRSTLVPSMDQIKRFTRLQYRIATPENEEFVATTLFTSLSLRKTFISKFVDAQKETEHKLQMTLQREKKAQEEKMRLMEQLQRQSIVFQREMSRTKMNLTQDTRQLVSMHASERTNAEERSNRLLQQTEQATLELERVKTELQSSQIELHTNRSNTEELNSTIGRLEQEVRDEKVKADEILSEAQANREEIQSYEEKCEDMQNSIEGRDDMISRVEDTNQKLQDNLEDLFADMCSLAQMYQHNEHQEESQKLKKSEAIEAVKQKLAVERRSNEGLTSKMADIEEENEKLYRKLGKYKEKLEEERKARREEQERKKEEEHRRKRNGPVSYLNSLHTSTTLDGSTDASRSRSTRTPSQRPPSQPHKSSRDRSAIHEKENSSSNYKSQRRAKY